MKFVSTKNQKTEGVSFSEALQRGIAEDGGLYVPREFPHFDISKFVSWQDLALQITAPFFEGDVLEASLVDAVKSAFSFPLPLKSLNENTAVLELFHGPTAAFKDVGARFLAALVKPEAGSLKTVLVATSGDTGGAVASAFFKKAGTEVVILFPKDRISPRQEKQLTAWGENVRAFSVLGSFDDCQRLVKEALRNEWWKKNKQLISANSINLGRLLPQTVYYAGASLQYFETKKRKAGFVIPSGNLGNSVAAFWAKRMGFPIGRIVLATNANKAVANYFSSGTWQAFATVHTLANAMDVGNPSNIERLLSLYPDFSSLKKDADAVSVSDEEIRSTIAHGPKNWGEVWCPHTAAAVHVRENIKEGDWIVVATAHPAKFDSIVEPLIGRAVSMPAALQEIVSRPSHCREITPDLRKLQEAVSG